jgi:hypothetical protein
MPQLGFELTTPVFERAKTVHASDRAAKLIQIGGEISILGSINMLILFEIRKNFHCSGWNLFIILPIYEMDYRTDY